MSSHALAAPSRILITGSAGFIGAALTRTLLDAGKTVIGIDSMEGHYGIGLKRARLETISGFASLEQHTLDLSNHEEARRLIVDANPDVIVHLAAQAGVRLSAERPFDYVSSNLVGQVAVLEATRELPNLQQLIYASSSSVYGTRQAGPFSETDVLGPPQSLYAATKQADELLVDVYAGSFGLAATGLRFFTVYGPYGRPDMAYWSFAEKIISGQTIVAYENGALQRDFTYIDDVIAGLLAVMENPAAPGTNRKYNLGNNKPQPVSRLIALLERYLEKEAIIQNAPKPAYDVAMTFANIDAMRADFGWNPTTSLQDGIAKFAEWYLTYAVSNLKRPA